LLYSAKYSNGEEAELYLNKKGPDYIGEAFIMLNQFGYTNFMHLKEGLQTGEAQNEFKGLGMEQMFQNPEGLKLFIKGMRGTQKLNFKSLAESFDFSKYQTLSDIGGASGILSCYISKAHPKIKCTSCDLPQIEVIAKEMIREEGMEDSVGTATLDFFKDEFPKSDIITMGNILHDWDEDTKLMLMKKSFDAINSGGAYIVIENIIDEQRLKSGLLMSLTMLLVTGGGFNFSLADFDGWAKKIGFKKVEKINIGNSNAIIAYK